jgi:hypothetical protein
MVRLPSQEEIEAANKALQPYFLALGKVAHSWNHLHEELGKVYCAVTGLELSIGMAVWHSLKSDRSQRDILEGAITAAAEAEEWQEGHPGALDGVTHLVNETNKLANDRNNAIHAPCDALPNGIDFEIMPITFFRNEKAAKLRGKDILKEFTWYERRANTLRKHARDVRLALDAQLPWPDKPRMPALGEADSGC